MTDIQEDFIREMRTRLEAFAQEWNVENAFSEDNPFEFSPLINARAGERFQWALQRNGGAGRRIGRRRTPGSRALSRRALLPAGLRDFPGAGAFDGRGNFRAVFCDCPVLGSGRKCAAAGAKAERETGERLLRIGPGGSKNLPAEKRGGFYARSTRRRVRACCRRTASASGETACPGRGRVSRATRSRFSSSRAATIRRCVTFKLPGSPT